MSIAIDRRLRGDVTVLDLAGRLTLGESSQAFRDEVRSQLSSGQTNILVNLAGVSYIDSSGVGDLVSAYATAKRLGATLKLLSLTQRVEDLLQLTKLLTIFEVFEDEDQAVASFGASQKAGAE